MKRIIRPLTILIVSLSILVMLSIAFSHSSHAQSSSFVGNTGAAFFFQTTTTPQPQVDKSEIGSTDNITIMTFAIVAIIVIPILLQRKHWSQN
jgi:preprotein translocase subunit SecG